MKFKFRELGDPIEACIKKKFSFFIINWTEVALGVPRTGAFGNERFEFALPVVFDDDARRNRWASENLRPFTNGERGVSAYYIHLKKTVPLLWLINCLSLCPASHI